MADIVNSSGTSPQRSNVSFAPSPCSSSNVLVSPNIVEAIDRIFPKSPSQLLQHSFSDGVSGSVSGKTTLSDGIRQSFPYPFSTLPCTTGILMANMTTHTTTTATAIFTNLSTTSGTTSPVMSSVPTSYMDIPSNSAQTKINNITHKNGTVDLNTNKTPILGKRISKADLEIMNNYSNSPPGIKEGSGLESNSPKKVWMSCDISDSDDMCRPFVNIQKEKKKRKRKHVTSEQRKTTNSDPSDSISPDSETPVSKISKLLPLQSSTSNDATEVRAFHGKIKSCEPTGEMNSNQLINDPNEVNGATHLSNNISNSSIGTCSPKNQTPPGKLRKKSKQGLPKSKRHRFHIQKDGRAIRKVFPPCFVVFKRFQGNFDDQSLTLKERIQTLSSLCAENKISCALKWKTKMLTKFKNVNDHSLSDNSEDEFRLARGRNLRRRRQDICYIEPTEDDLMEDITSDFHLPVSKNSQDPVKEDHSPNDNHHHTKGKLSKKQVELQVPLTKDNGNVLQERKNKSCPDPNKSQESVISKSSALKDLQTAKASKVIHLAKSQSTSSLEDNAQKICQKDAKGGSIVNKTSVGPSLVYVYPKTTILSNIQANISINVTSAHSSTTKTKSAKSKTESSNKSNSSKSGDILNPVTVTSGSNLGLNAGMRMSTLTPLLGTVSNATLAASSPFIQSVPQMTTRTNTSLSDKSSLPTNLCMVKIAGKDYLLSMPSNNIRGPTNSSAPASINHSQISSLSVAGPGPGPRPLIYQANTGLRSTAFSQGNIGVTPTFTFPFQRSSITIPDRIAISSAIHTLPSTIHQNSSISSVSLLGKSNASTSSISTFTQSLLATTQPIIQVSRLSRGEVTSSTSRASLISSSTTQEKRAASSGTSVSTQATSIVVHQCPSLTSTGLSSTSQVETSSASIPGARCFRIIVPACSVAGSGTRIATLGTSTLSSPLSRLTASSTLLPQRKQNSRSDLTPEQLAAKRRKLEKKYPLPPGVVIKTEPLENPSQSSSVSSGPVRSLLSAQNIQLIAASSRSAVGGVQRFRIIAPSSGGLAVGSRPLRFGSNVIIRAPVISPFSSRPQSSSLLTTVSVSSTVSSTQSNIILNTNTTSASVSRCNSVITTSQIMNTNISTSCPTSSSVTGSSSGTISLLSSSSLLLTSVGSQSTPALQSGKSSLPFASTTSNFVFTQPSSSSTTLCPSVSKDTIEATSENQRGTRVTSFSTLPARSVNKSVSTNDEIEKLRQSVENLVRLISEQEALGLKGQRLEKLKELLTSKKNSLSQLENGSDEPLSTTTSESESMFDSSVQETVVID